MYDLNTIMAAVGGSLGLFLGFSCLDFACTLAVYVLKMIFPKELY